MSKMNWIVHFQPFCDVIIKTFEIVGLGLQPGIIDLIARWDHTSRNHKKNALRCWRIQATHVEPLQHTAETHCDLALQVSNLEPVPTM